MDRPYLNAKNRTTLTDAQKKFLAEYERLNIGLQKSFMTTKIDDFLKNGVHVLVLNDPGTGCLYKLSQELQKKPLLLPQVSDVDALFIIGAQHPEDFIYDELDSASEAGLALVFNTLWYANSCKCGVLLCARTLERIPSEIVKRCEVIRWPAFNTP